MPEYSLSKPLQTYLYPTGSNEEPKNIKITIMNEMSHHNRLTIFTLICYKLLLLYVND